MHATFGQLVMLTIGAVVGFGLTIGMERNGISFLNKETREKAICYLIIYCCAWIVGMTLILKVLGE